MKANVLGLAITCLAASENCQPFCVMRAKNQFTDEPIREPLSAPSELRRIVVMPRFPPASR